MLRLSKIFVLLCFIILSFGYAKFAHADCVACFELRGVTVERKDGSIISGYVTWNEGWFVHEDYKPQFPETLIDIENIRKYFNVRVDRLIIYKELYVIDKPFKIIDYDHKPKIFLVTSDSDMEKVPFNEIRSIKAKPMKHDGYIGAGEVGSYPRNILKIITQETPVAVIVEDAGSSDEYYISYNPEIKEDKLKEKKNDINHCNTTTEGCKKVLEQFEKEKIVILSISYD